MDRHRLEKLKTIGDSYMFAGGIPAPNRTHAVDCVLCALEIQAFMQQMKEIKGQQGLPYWELRLGIHSGDIVAGVIGEKSLPMTFGAIQSTLRAGASLPGFRDASTCPEQHMNL